MASGSWPRRRRHSARPALSASSFGAAARTAAGSGGDSLTPYAAEKLPWLRHPDFTRMTAPALVVAADEDELPMTVRGAA
jgi:hypothetical protein